MNTVFAAIGLIALLPGSAAGDASVEEGLAARLPGVEAENVKPTPIAGLWEVSMGPQVVYVSEDGRYLVRGDVVDMMNGDNLTRARQAELQAKIMDRLAGEFDESTMVVFPAENARHTVTVFTDVDCTYCRKLHREIESYTAQGISVRYMFYPIAGPGSAGWTKADAVWCSSDRNDAMTRAKLGQSVTAEGACEDTPVAAHYRLAMDLGLRGTPAIVTDGGAVVPGYLPAAELARMLEQE